MKKEEKLLIEEVANIAKRADSIKNDNTLTKNQATERLEKLYEDAVKFADSKWFESLSKEDKDSYYGGLVDIQLAIIQLSGATITDVKGF